MSEQVPPPAPDESRGDLGDQASRLQMEEEQAAIHAALDGNVSGTDAYEDRSYGFDMLGDPDLLDAESIDASDDPMYGGGMPITDPVEAALSMPEGDSLSPDLAMTGLYEAGTAMALDEGSTVTDGPALGFEQDGDPDFLDEDLRPLDDESAAEDLDALIDVFDLGHDPDDPQDPDGYGMPPASDGGTAVIDQALLRDPVAGPSDSPNW